jgi:peptidoglycan/LPS O-acetylase OafA/YrhL
MRKLPNLTSFRFLLALTVVLYHIHGFSRIQGIPSFDDYSFLNKGQEAVHMFFSLSGFLIIRQLYIEKLKTSTISLKKFFLRRILRIFPLYYLILGFGLFHYRYLLPHIGYHFESNYDFTLGLILSLSFFSNIFATFGPGGILEMLWSLGIEEQFYLFIAPVILSLPVKKIIPFLGIFSVIYFILFYSSFLPFLQHYSLFFFYFSTSGFFSLVLLKYDFTEKFKYLKIPVFLLLFLYFATPIFTNYFSEIYYSLFSMFLFGIFISYLISSPIKLLDNRIMEYLGKISYGVYMYHAIAMQIVGFIYLKYSVSLNVNNLSTILAMNLVVIALTILMSHISYKYYESYFLNLKKKFRGSNE